MFCCLRMASSLSWSSLRIGLPRLLPSAVSAPGVQPLRRLNLVPPPVGPERLGDLGVADPVRELAHRYEDEFVYPEDAALADDRVDVLEPLLCPCVRMLLLAQNLTLFFPHLVRACRGRSVRLRDGQR